MGDLSKEYDHPLPEARCRECKVVGQVRYYIWEAFDGGHEDCHYRCFQCGADWWIDGIDS
jgi:hypothetical protein